MGILIIAGVLIITVIWLIGEQSKRADGEAISKASDTFRRIGYGDKTAFMEDWEYLKKTERKWIICEAYGKVKKEFEINGNTEALHLLVLCIGDEIIEYLKELGNFYEKADEEARSWMK